MQVIKTRLINEENKRKETRGKYGDQEEGEERSAGGSTRCERMTGVDKEE